MAINRENYEIWFIDYLDGSLDQQSTEQLRAFLGVNPDLAEELQRLENVTLESSDEIFEKKDDLFKYDSGVSHIEELDRLMIKKIEEGLTKEEEISLADYIDKNPKLLIILREYMNTRLIADETVQYPSKTSLLRRRFRPVFVAWSGIAAAFVLFLGYQGYNFINKPQGSFSTDVQLSYMTAREAKVFPLETISTTNYSLSPVKKADYFPENRALVDNSMSDKEIELPETKLPSLLASKGIEDLKFQVTFPNVYETGLRHMMPLYLDINNNRNQLLAEESTQNRQGVKESNILLWGLQFVDKVSGELISFDKVYDEQGNYIAYNLKAMNLEIEQKVRP